MASKPQIEQTAIHNQFRDKAFSVAFMFEQTQETNKLQQQTQSFLKERCPGQGAQQNALV